MLLDPARAFAGPEDVLGHEELTRQQKIRVLKIWEHDAAEAEVATEEGMPGSNGSLLRRIMLALHALSDEARSLRTDPSKQHSLL